MESPATLVLNPYQARAAAALFERLFPADDLGPGALAIGVCTYLDRALGGPYRDKAESYRSGLTSVDRVAQDRHGQPFAVCSAEQQDALLLDLERGELPHFGAPAQTEFFQMLRAHLQEGLFSDPAYGGNREKLGWKFLGHPGIWFENSAEENIAREPVTKGGEIRSLADVEREFDAGPAPEQAPPPAGRTGYVIRRPAGERERPADVVLVGVGAMGSLAARMLSHAALRVVGIEAGPWRTTAEYVADELGSAYYCRGDMGQKFLSETPRWRRRLDDESQEAQFSLGRMMNGVGGSVIH